MSENYYNEISVSDLEILKRLKIEIENTNYHDRKFSELLNKYHEELDDLFLYNPLSPEYELEESLLPEGYLEFKRSCQSCLPYTFSYHCQKKDAIALIEIVSVNSTNTEIYGKLLKLFKGNQNWFKKNWYGHIYFKSAGWFRPRFKKNEKALILLDEVDELLVVYSTNDKLIIDFNDNTALSSYRDREVYWSDFRSWYKDNLLAVNWEEIERFLINL
jgi:hypothetical protein